MNKAKVKKLRDIIVNVILYTFLAICIFSVFFTVFSRKEADGAAEIFGYQMRIVTSDSMSKCEYTDTSDFEIKDIPIRSMVFVQAVPKNVDEAYEWYQDLEVGDVLTFRFAYTTQVTITHRITSIEKNDEGGFTIQLAGDNKNSENGQLYQEINTATPNSVNYVIGKVTGQSYFLGLIMSFLMQPVGILLAIIVPCVVIILIEALKIANIFMADKKKWRQEEEERKDNELEELRRRVAELEGERNKQAVDKEDKTE